MVSVILMALRLVTTPRAERANRFVNEAASGGPLKIERPDANDSTRSVTETGAT